MADTPTDNRVPTLAVIGGDANNVLGQVNYIGMDKPVADPNAPQRPAVRPVEGQLTVATAGIRDAENQLIWEAKYQVGEYETFKKTVLDEEKWVFLVSDPHDMEVYHHNYKAPVGKAGFMTGWGGQAEGDYADFVDPNPSQTAETIDGQHNLLRMVGDAMESIGHMVATLNNAAQLYALADENSVAPKNTVPITPLGGTDKNSSS